MRGVEYKTPGQSTYRPVTGVGRCVRNVGARGSNPLTSTHQQPLCRKGCSLFQDRFPIAPILDPPTSVRDRVGDELFGEVLGL